MKLEILYHVRHSETTLSFYFSDEVDDALVLEIGKFAELVRENLAGCIESVACGTSVFVEFHILRTSAEEAIRGVYECLDRYQAASVRESEVVKKIVLPVYYGEEVSGDLRMLADAKKLSIAEVVKLHSESVYKVVSLGFAPGFAYLSGLDERLMMPRMSVPKKVAKGSVGIADAQTAVYPKSSPGGWVIIGNCPLELFNAKAGRVEEISPFEIGTEVRFVPVGYEEFLRLGGKV